MYKLSVVKCQQFLLEEEDQRLWTKEKMILYLDF